MDNNRMATLYCVSNLYESENNMDATQPIWAAVQTTWVSLQASERVSETDTKSTTKSHKDNTGRSADGDFGPANFEFFARAQAHCQLIPGVNWNEAAVKAKGTQLRQQCRRRPTITTTATLSLV